MTDWLDQEPRGDPEPDGPALHWRTIAVLLLVAACIIAAGMIAR